MARKVVINDKALEIITTLSLLVGRFDKMQVYDINGCHDVLMSFEIERWREDKQCFKTEIEPFVEHYPVVKHYMLSMNRIFEKQNKYRRENDLQSTEDWLKENEC